MITKMFQNDKSPDVILVILCKIVNVHYHNMPYGIGKENNPLKSKEIRCQLIWSPDGRIKPSHPIKTFTDKPVPLCTDPRSIELYRVHASAD